MKERLEALRQQALSELKNADAPKAIEEFRVRFMGKKGPLTELLRGMGSLLRERLGAGADLALKGWRIEASHVRQAGKRRDFKAKRLVDGKTTTYWATDDDCEQPTLTFSWKTPQSIHAVLLQEHIALGQRVRKFRIETSADGISWQPHAQNICTTIGYKRIIPLSGSTEGWQGVDDVRFLRAVS